MLKNHYHFHSDIRIVFFLRFISQPTKIQCMGLLKFRFKLRVEEEPNLKDKYKVFDIAFSLIERKVLFTNK